MEKETLEESAENYGWKIKTNTFSNPVKANELAESAKQDFIEGAKWQAEQEYAEHLADETKKWDDAQTELEAYRQHQRSSEYKEKKLKFKQELNDAMHEAHQTGRVINQEQSAFVKKDDVDGEWLSPVATERVWQEEQLVNIFGHYPNASPRWQYMNGLILNSLQAERMYSEEELREAIRLAQFNDDGAIIPMTEEEIISQFKKK